MRKLFLLSFLNLVFLSGVAFSQTPQMTPEQRYLKKAAADEFDMLRESARSSLYGVLLYPEDIQTAVLELSQFPELIVLLNEKEILAEGKFSEKIAGYDSAVQESAAVLSEYREVVKILEEYLVVTAIMGEIYKKDKVSTRQVILRLSKTVHEDHEGAVQAWTNRLDEDSESLMQLQEAASQHAIENGLPDPNLPLTQDQINNNTYITNNYGYYVDPNQKVVVYDMPSQDFMSYMMLNQATYLMLYSSMSWHHHHYYDDHYWHYYDDYWDDQYDDFERLWEEDIESDLDGLEQDLEELNKNIDELQEGFEDRKDDWQDNFEDRKNDWQDRKDEFDLEGKKSELQDKWNSSEGIEKREAAKDKWNSSEGLEKRAAAKDKWNSPEAMEKRESLKKADFNEKFKQYQSKNDAFSAAGVEKWKKNYDRSFSNRSGSGFGSRTGNTNFSSMNRSQRVDRASQFHSRSWNSASRGVSRSGSRNISRSSGGGSRNFDRSSISSARGNIRRR